MIAPVFCAWPQAATAQEEIGPSGASDSANPGSTLTPHPLRVQGYGGTPSGAHGDAPPPPPADAMHPCDNEPVSGGSPDADHGPPPGAGQGDYRLPHPPPCGDDRGDDRPPPPPEAGDGGHQPKDEVMPSAPDNR